MTPLFIACNMSNIPLVKLLLEHGADPMLADDSHTTPLIVACLRNSLEIATLLIAAGADPNQSSQVADSQLTPLMIATSRDNPALVGALIQKGARIDFVRRNDDASAFTVAWHQSCFQAMYEIVLRCPTREGQLVLVYHDSSLEIIFEILRTCAASSVSPALRCAPTAPGGANTLAIWTVVRVLLSRLKPLSLRAEEASNTSFLLQQAIADLLPVALVQRDIELVTVLLQQQKLDPNNRHYLSRTSDTPLLLALHSNDLELVQVLLDYGADPNMPFAGGGASDWPVQFVVDRISEPLAVLKLLLLHPKAPTIALSLSDTARRERLLRSVFDKRKVNKPILHLLLAAGAAAYRLPLLEVKDGLFIDNEMSCYDERIRVERELCNLMLTPLQAVRLLGCDFTNIASLNLSGNSLQQLFDISLLSSRLEVLHTLQLRNCGLQEVPLGLGGLKSLTSLDLSTNTITSLQPVFADSIASIPVGLRYLNLRANPLTTLPLQLYTLTSLLKLEIDVSALGQSSGIPEAVLRLPTASLLGYLRAVSEKTTYWNKAKLLVVGEENVGKTTLIRHLLTGDFLTSSRTADSTENLSTDGINISGMRLISFFFLLLHFFFFRLFVYFPLSFFLLKSFCSWLTRLGMRIL
jgi:ankyrin repeat protein